MTLNAQPADGLRRTAWLEGSVLPTIPGEYECATGGGHVFRRMFDGTNWLNSVDGKPTTVRMLWRGVEPGVDALARYPTKLRPVLTAGWPAVSGSDPMLYDPNDPNAGALAA